MKVFISYSHKDDVAFDRLRTHLAVLRQQEYIDEWYDRKILPGDVLDYEISQKLESSEIFLLLVSPGFLESHYCRNIEMKRALERYKSGKVRVIPIILDPCDCKNTSLGGLRALPRDGKPISKWSNENEAYDDVVKELRRVIEAENPQHNTVIDERESTNMSIQPSVGQTRVKRNFDEIDHDEFREMTFNTIRDHFKSGIEEIDEIDNLIGRFQGLFPTSFNCTIIKEGRYRHSNTHITVRSGAGDMTLGDISYSLSENMPTGTVSSMFWIESDGYELFLKPINLWSADPDHKLTPEATAQKLWVNYSENAGIPMLLSDLFL